MTMLQSDGTTAIGVLRLFALYEPDCWLYADLYVTPEAMDAVAEHADVAGLDYDRFEPQVYSAQTGYNDLAGGLKYVDTTARRHHEAAAGKAITAPLEERAGLPPPKHREAA